MKSLIKDSPKVLVVRLDLVGDFICTMPLFEAIKDCFPSAELHLLTSDYTLPFAQASPFVDKIIIYPKKKHSKNKKMVFCQQIKALFSIRREKYDLLLAPKANFNRRQGIISLFSKAKLRIGRLPSKNQKKFYKKFAQKSFDILLPPCNDKHEVEACLELLQPVCQDINKAKYNLHLKIPVAKQKIIKSKLDNLSLSFPVFGYHISSRGKVRRWPLENFKQLISYLLDRFPFSSHLITFVPQDRDKAKKLAKYFDRAWAVSTQDLMELAALARYCDLFISLDGGPMHIAAATGIKTIGLFVNASSEIVKRWSPWGENNVALGGGGSISVDRVLETVFELMSK